jgi:hypothetical protein
MKTTASFLATSLLHTQLVKQANLFVSNAMHNLPNFKRILTTDVRVGDIDTITTSREMENGLIQPNIREKYKQWITTKNPSTEKKISDMICDENVQIEATHGCILEVVELFTYDQQTTSVLPGENVEIFYFDESCMRYLIAHNRCLGWVTSNTVCQQVC